TVTSKGTGDKPGVPDVTNDESSESEYESWGNDEDDNKNKQEPSDESKFDQEKESKDDEMKSDEEQGMDDTTDQFDDDADARLEEPTETATGIVQGEGNDTEMIEAQQGNENLETTQEQDVEDAHVTISTVPKKTGVPVTSYSRDEVTLAKVSCQPQSTYEAASTLTEFELKKILLDKMEKSESYLTAPEHRECYDGLKKSYALNQDVFYFYDVYTLKRGRKDKDKDEDPSAGSDRGLKRIKTSKDAEPTTDPKKKDSISGSSKGTKFQPRSSGKSVQSEKPLFKVADSDMPQDQKGDMGDNEDEPRKKTASISDWFKKPTPV
ncbi:hypothetical protein Tco_0934344, partial [Tanacetum coccineum]